MKFDTDGEAILRLFWHVEFTHGYCGAMAQCPFGALLTIQPAGGKLTCKSEKRCKFIF